MTIDGSQEIASEIGADLAFATVVTRDLLDQFQILRQSAGLAVGAQPTWFVRADGRDVEKLHNIPGVHVSVAERANSLAAAPKKTSPEFVSEALAVINAAWQSRARKVIYCAPDVVIVKDFWNQLGKNATFIASKEKGENVDPFTAGALVMADESFKEWWEKALANAQPSRPLEKLINYFHRECRPGFFRSFYECDPQEMFDNKTSLVCVDLERCDLFRVSLFDGAARRAELAQSMFLQDSSMVFRRTQYKPFFQVEQMFRRAFGIHILRALSRSSCARHTTLAGAIINGDGLGLYGQYVEAGIAAA